MIKISYRGFCRVFALSAASAVLLICLLILLDWLIPPYYFRQLSPKYGTTQFNTALLFILLASGVLASLYNRRKFALLFFLLIPIIPLATLGADALGGESPFDSFLFEIPPAPRMTHPGRMSPVTAALFLLFSGSGLLLNLRLPRKLSVIASNILLGLAVGVVLTNLFAYAVQFEGQILIPGYTNITPLTLLLALLLSLSLIFAHELNAGEKEPVFVGAPLFLTIVLLYINWRLLYFISTIFFSQESALQFILVVFGAQVVLLSLALGHLSYKNRKLNTELSFHRHRLEAVLDAALEAILIIDSRGWIRYANRTTNKILGIDPEKALNDHLYRYIKVKEPGQIEEVLGGLKKETRSSEALAKPDASIAFVELNCRAIEANGETEEAVVVLHDATSTVLYEKQLTNALADLRRKNAELKQAQKNAEIALFAKNEFLRNMSHELRTPLNGIMGLADLLAATELTSQQKKYVTLIKEPTDHLAQLVEGILAVTKIEADKAEVSYRAFNLHEILDQTLNKSLAAAAKKNLSLKIDLTALPKNVIGDPGALSAILHELVGNAVKYTEKGAVVVSGNIASEDEFGYQLSFTIQDSGIGIPEKKLQSLFELFSQGDSSTSKYFGGVGKGMHFVKRLMDLHNGRLEVTSKEGEGTTIVATLPFEKAYSSYLEV